MGKITLDKFSILDYSEIALKERANTQGGNVNAQDCQQLES